MFDFHEKRKIRSFLYSKTCVVIIFIIAIGMSFTVYNRYSIAQDMKRKLEGKHAELTELKNRAEVLNAKVKYLEDDRGIEEELRNRFDVAKEGEQVIILIDPKEDASNYRVSEGRETNTSGNEENIPKKSFLDFLKFW